LSWAELVDWRVNELVTELVRGLLQFIRCDLLLLEAGSWGRGQIGNSEAGERPPLKAATKERPVETVTDWKHKSVCDNDL
jgi:hypothetical protein